MKPFSVGAFEELVHNSHTNPQEALAQLKEWEEAGVNDQNLTRNKPGILIDIGSGLREQAIIHEGIDLLEEERAVLEKQGDSLSASQWFNLGNGYYAIEASRRNRGDGYVYDPSETPMARAKECYRQAIESIEKETSLAATDEETTSLPQLKTELLINYGNALNELGRIIEAADIYDSALINDIEHPMAWQNLGGTLYDLAVILNNAHFLRESADAYEESLKDDRFERYSYSQNRLAATDKLKKINSYLSKIKFPNNGHKKPLIPNEYSDSFIKFCVSNSLFLNFSLRSLPSPHPYEDNFKFSVTTPIKDEVQFPRLVRSLNEFVERYSISRLMLFEAIETPYETEFYETITRYIDLYDFPVYGIRAAKLKLAYESGFNILDKLALFLNSYLCLNIDEKRVNFSSIWRDVSVKKSFALRPEILNSQNIYLMALYDLACDFNKNSKDEEGYWANYKETRHALTHRYQVIHICEQDWHIVERPDQHCTWDDMVQKTISLLYYTRNAVLYTMLAIQLEEHRHYSDDSVDQSKIYEDSYYLQDTKFPISW